MPSTDGRRIVYHCAGDIWILDDLDGQARPLDVRLASPVVGRSPRLISAEDHLGDLSCDHTGQASAVEVRGTVHWLTHRDGPARALTVTPRARLPRVLGRTGQVVWVSDADGEQALEIASADGITAPAAPAAPAGPAQARSAVDGPAPPREGGEGHIDHGGSGGAPGLTAGAPRRLAAGQLGRVTDIAAAPDGMTVAVAARDGRLLVVDVASGQVTELAASADGAVTGLAYSPDSAWLAWAQPGPRPLSRIRIARRADRMIADVTDGRFTDTEPVFTADGRYLAFLSWRGFDPVYDAHFFDLSFPLGCRPYLVPLAAGAPSPFGPLPEGRPVSRAAAGDDRDEAEPGPPVVPWTPKGSPGGWCQVPGARGALLLAAAGQGRARLAARAADRRARRGRRASWTATPRAALERFDLDRRHARSCRRARLVRGQRRRDQARGQRPGRPAGARLGAEG